MMTVTQIKGLAERYERAREIVEAGRVAPVYGQDGVYVVLNGEGYAYLANLTNETCTCPDAQYRAAKLGIPCKHLIAAALYRERQPDPNGGRGRSPRRRYQCDRCGSVIESDEGRTGERCLACLAIDPTAPRGRYQPVDEPEPEPEPEYCEVCGSELGDGECGACIAAHERTYGGSLVRDADGIVTELW